MDPALKRRLDALVVLCATLLGLQMTAALTTTQLGVGLLAVAIFPTGLILLAVFAYIGREAVGDPDTETAG
jgi:heme A synthase